MNIRIVKVDLNTSIKKKDGGQYNGHNVVYEDEGEVKSKGFHEKVLEYRPELKETIESLEEGKWYNVEMEKNDKGYWDWKNVTETSAQSNKSQQSGTSNKDGITGTAVGHSLHCASRLLSGMGDVDKETLKKVAYIVYDTSIKMQAEIREGTRTDNTEF